MKFTASTHLTPGEDLLAAVIASRWNPDRLAEIPALVTKTDLDDWQRVITWHGLAGIITKLHQPALAQLPEDFARVPAQIHARHVPKALQQFKVLADVHRILNDAGVPHMPLKGLFLSLQLYGDIATRISTDIDVLIDPHDLQLAFDALRDGGFVCELPALGDSLERRLLRWAGHDIGWRAPAGEKLELHQRSDMWSTLSLPAFRVLQPRLQGCQCGPIRTCQLPVELLVDSLAKHAVRSYCHSWKWGYDVLHLRGADSIGSPVGRISDSKAWSESLCVEIMREQLREDPPQGLSNRLAKATEFLGAIGVAERKAKIAGTANFLTGPTIRGRMRLHLSEMVQHYSVAHKIAWLYSLLTIYHAKGDPRLMALVASVPILAPFVRSLRLLLSTISAIGSKACGK